MCNWYSHPGYLPKSQGRVCLGQKGTMQLAQTILVTSGKGGVGKSTVSVLLGAALAQAGKVLLVAPDDIGGMSTLTKDRGAILTMYHKGRSDAKAIGAFLAGK